MMTLPEDIIAERAGKIKLLISDNDGVFTDNGVYYSERGEELKRYSVRDGMGVERLLDVSVQTGIMTGEISPNLKKELKSLVSSISILVSRISCQNLKMSFSKPV